MNRPTRLFALPVVALVAVLGACGNPPERAATVGTDTPAQPLAGPEMEKIARTGMAKVAAAAKS